MTLKDFFAVHPRTALAFSGGVDSAYLLYAGLQAGAELRPYFVKTVFQPGFELKDAQRLCRELGVPLRVLTPDILAHAQVRENSPARCYHCKTVILSAIRAAAAEDGFTLLLDGSNASDLAADRPGMRALAEAQVLSPLRLCGLSKAEIRRLSREAGLFTWDKPAYACLATRIQTGVPIEAETLQRIEAAESWLTAQGFTNLRVRSRGAGALLQFDRTQLPEALLRAEELKRGLPGGFCPIEIDPEGRNNP